MNYRIGDKVRFLNESGGGTVTSLPSGGTVGVTTDDGFEIPYHVSQLILVSRGNDAPDEEEEIEKYTGKELIFEKLTKEEGIYLGFVTEGTTPMTSEIEFYLINKTNYSVQYVVSRKDGLKQKLIRTGNTGAKSEEYVDTFIGKNAAVLEQVLVQLLFYNETVFTARQPLFKTLQINTLRLQSPEYYKEQQGLKLQVIAVAEPPRKEDPRELLSHVDEYRKDKTRTGKKLSDADHDFTLLMGADEVVDLHIESLTDDYTGMSNAEIVNLQLSAFRQAMDKAILSRLHKVTFIHGVGKGKLKEEIRRELNHYPGASYRNAPMHKFGFGATEVVFG
ncbi:MAG: DUF2027 domain-containing protein [Bacteroidia bacterium]